MKILEALIIAYVLGSLPSAVWIGKAFFKTDVREHGSGNAGATNTFRVLGWRAGSIVLALDVAKGWLSVDIARQLQLEEYWVVLCGIVAILGHIYPIFAKFKGGKGIATSLGIVLALHPPAALLTLFTFIFFFLASGMVSLGSIIASIGFPLWLIFKYPDCHWSIKIFGLIIALVILFTHRKNIVRIIQGNENRFFGGRNV
jgi:glycerol-3-phosphate acyltransferase PlsY